MPKDDGFFLSRRTTGPDPLASSGEVARDLLEAESKVDEVFDRLAGRISQSLDYPQMLVENGVHGGAALDLYFDSLGHVDELKSQISGENRLIRGLLVRAARKGLVAWLDSDAYRLRKDQFRNQHFRADFLLAYSQRDQAEVQRLGPASYSFLRRKVSNTACLGAYDGSPLLDVACIAAGIGGAIHRKMSDSYKTQYGLLKDRLESYDALDLRGLNAEVGRGV